MPTIVLTNGLKLSCAERGQPTGPALVMLHGPTDSWWSYQFVLDRLPLTIRAIAASQRGHGDSDKPRAGYRVEDFASDVLLLLDALKIERAFLVGHSASCLVARRVALDAPERVLGLVLEASPVTLRSHAGFEAFVRSTVLGLQDPIDLDFVHSFVVGTSSKEVDPNHLDRLVTEVAKVPARVWRETFTALQTYDDTGELSAIMAPTLLIWGDADGVVGEEEQRELLSRIVGARLRVYQGAGHTPRWEDPTRFAADLATFVLQPPTDG